MRKLTKCPHCPKSVDTLMLKYHIKYSHTKDGQEWCRRNGRLGAQVQKEQRLHLLDEPVRLTAKDLLPKIEQSITRDHKQTVRKYHKSW